MDFEQAVAIVLQYDTYPTSLLDTTQKAALMAAKGTIADYAHRAVSEFVGHEGSKKYLDKVFDYAHPVPPPKDVVTINESAHGHEESHGH